MNLTLHTPYPIWLVEKCIEPSVPYFMIAMLAAVLEPKILLPLHRLRVSLWLQGLNTHS